MELQIPKQPLKKVTRCFSINTLSDICAIPQCLIMVMLLNSAVLNSIDKSLIYIYINLDKAIYAF